MSSKSLCFAALGLLLIPCTLPAQGTFARQAREAVDDAYFDLLSDRGFSETGDLYEGSLDDDEEENVWITLSGRDSYAILGACDEDCGDLDLWLYDEDGDEIDSDVSIDAEPVVEVENRRTQDYRVRVKMYNCGTEPCYYAFAVYRRGGGGRGGDGGGSSGMFARQAREALDDAYFDLLSDRGFSETGDLYEGSLDDDGEENVWITLSGRDSYAILGACDEDCGDLDLFLYDEDGDEIDTDASIDAEPVVEVENRRTQDYRVRVRMYNCGTEPCYYAFAVYRRGGGGRGERGGGSLQQRVRRALDEAYFDMLADRGYEETGDVYEGALDDDEEEDIWVTLRRNRSYSILSVCDEDCSDIDLFLYDDDGDQIDSDTSIDEAPVVRETPNRTGEYRIRVRMYVCSTEPCYYAVGVYER